METPKYEDLNSNNCREKIIKMYYPEFWQLLTTKYGKPKFTENLYLYYNKLDKPPVCKVCSGPVKFINMRMGYRDFCSLKCQGSSIETKLKKQETSLKHYGTTNPMTSKEVQEKQKATCLEKYGVDNVYKSEDIKEKIKKTNLERYGVEHAMDNPEIKEKFRQNCLKKYGVDWSSKTEESKKRKEQTNIERYGFKTNLMNNDCKEKIKRTIIERYGVDNPTKSKEICEKIKKTNLEKYGVEYSKQKDIFKKYDDIIKIDGVNYVCKCQHPKCNKCEEKQYEIPSFIYLNRKYHKSETCTKLLPVDNSISKNTSIEIFIKDILDEYGISYIENDRKILNGQELDIYIPEKKLAIECNGCYWHSNIYKDNKYHYEKYKKCENVGIQLITIWEDWIINNPERVKWLLKSKLGVYEKRIGARECEIVSITPKESTPLLEAYHIQGNSTAGGVKYGLYHKGELVEVMTFSKGRKSIGNGKDDYWELVRLCSKGGVQVIGGAERLLKRFISDYKPSKIISFASHDISNGNVYEKLGFKNECEISSSYWYIDKNFKRYHRYNFTKYRLVQDGYDKEKTEEQIMAERGYMKIYDSGQTKYVLNL